MVLGINTATVALSITGTKAASSLRRFSVLSATALSKPRGKQRAQQRQIECEDSTGADIVGIRTKGKGTSPGKSSGYGSPYGGRRKMPEEFQDAADRIGDLALGGGAGKGGRNRRGGRCGGGGGGRGGEGAERGSRELLISKALSTLLRHQAQNAGIKLDAEGYAPLDKVVSALLLLLSKSRRLHLCFHFCYAIFLMLPFYSYGPLL